MTKPIIGVTTSRVLQKIPFISVPEAYIQAVIKAGGIPLLIPVGLKKAALEDLQQRLDGLLLTGGGDIAPALFNGRPHPRIYDIDLDRDEMEIQLVRSAAKSRLPFMGICRGIQLVNVAFGGDLYTDLTDQFSPTIRHDCYPDLPRNHLAHTVSLEAGSRLEGILGSGEVSVNSLHHQGVKQVAAEFHPTAWSPDGLVEGIELSNHPYGLAVQWHPEWLQDDIAMQNLFRSFVNAAQGG